MPEKKKRLYWDTSCFICFLNKNEKSRRAICENILKNAKERNVTLYTSSFTIAEVINPRRSSIPNPKPLTSPQITKIQAMFKWPWLKKMDVDQRVAQKAVELARQYGIYPSDAIQAASAILLRVDALQRWDRDFDKIAKLIKVENPTRISLQEEFEGMRGSIGPEPEDFEEKRQKD